MCWFYLFLGILLDVAGTVFLKLSAGFTRLMPSLLTLACFAASLLPLSLATRQLPVTLVYAAWSAIGTILVATVGMLWFEEPATAVKIMSLVLIIAGLVGLEIR